MRLYDSVMASKTPVLQLPQGYQHKSLPVSVDNSNLPFFPGIYEQKYFTCQQYSGVSYTYAYERNRLMNRDGALPENRFPAHYSWIYMNNADRYTGVSFFYSFQLLKEQGHITSDDYGHDTSQGWTGWITGYDQYLRAMKNRLKGVYAIPTNTPEGVLTLKHYLHDHLDGSPYGGIACFSASSNFQSVNVKELPYGTPEAGKEVIIAFFPIATHGMTIVGYNDSVRYDLNADGMFTNDMDITGDGIADVRDWEIGAWRMANSYGKEWHDKGYSYILYSAAALDYDYPGGNWVADRGLWNNSVYIVEPDTNYTPKLTAKFTLTYNARNRIKIRAGVSTDTSLLYPEHTIDFPLFARQGGDHFMQGFDHSDELKTMEAGLDITPLLSFIHPGQAVRFFLSVEERDTLHTGEGMMNHCSFIDYSNGGIEYPVSETDVVLEDNAVTSVSATATIQFLKPEITTGMLPAYKPGQPYHVQLESAGGKAPVKWSLGRSYWEKETDSAFIAVDQVKIAQEATYIPYKVFPLPFAFPFYGEKYDTIYINFYGFISFDSEQLPYPYITDEEFMMRRNAMIAPAFCMKTIYANNSYGIWVESHPSRVTIRWETGDPYISSFRLRSELRIYPDGKFEFIYGDNVDIPSGYLVFKGYSAGDEHNHQIEANFDPSSLRNRSFLYSRLPLPEGLDISEDGLLSALSADTSKIFEINVRVTDANRISAATTFTFSDGPFISQQVVCGDDSLVRFGTDAHLRLKIWNGSDSSLSGISVKLSSADPSVMIADSILSLPDMLPGSHEDVSEAFSFTLKSPLKDGSIVEMVLTIISGTRHWEKEVPCHVTAPVVSIPSVRISDGYDGLLDPGEVAGLVARISNSGTLQAEGLLASLTTEDTLLSILTDPEVLLERIEATAETEVTFLLSASKNAPMGYKASMLLSLKDQKSVNLEVPVTVVLGKVPIAIVSFTSDSTSPKAMKSALDSLHIQYSSFLSIPPRPEGFSCIFISAGTSTGGHMLTLEESARVADYLETGGKLYLEVSPAWYYYYKGKTALNPMLKYSSEKVPIYYYTSFAGVEGTLSEDLAFEYQHSMNHSIYDFHAVSPAVEIFQDVDSITNTFQIAFTGANYRTIASIIEFGWLSDGEEPSTRQTLMRRYLDFFDVEKTGPKVFFHSDRNQICRWDTVHFTDDSFDNIVSWHWEFLGGNPSSSPDPDPSVLYVDPGKYDVKLTVSDGVYTKQIVKKDFIDVRLCTGIPVQEPRPVLSVYPNPADDLLHVSFTGQFIHNAFMEIYDMTGRLIIEKKVQSDNLVNDCEIDISSLCRGFYILILKTDSMKASAKIIVN